MQLRSVSALDPRQFGRRDPFILDCAREPAPTALLDDLKLFATTFVGGFLFVAVYLA